MTSFSRYDPRARYRQRSQQNLSVLSGFCVVAFLCFGVGYGVGYQSSEWDQGGVQRQFDELKAERDKLQATVTRVLADSHSANVKFQQIENQIESDIPQDGPMRNIIAELKVQLDSGADPERIASVIKTLSPPKNCMDPDVKRFIVQTPKNEAKNHAGSIANGLINISVQGKSALSKSGKDETWFDPAKPVKVNMSWKDGVMDKAVTLEKTLPFSHMMTIKDVDYRLTFASGAKSFIKVTYDSCAR